ncbi:MAG: hypothetical protein IKU25_08670 [Clostridia bacterium]|nr:hypothetical protein [Clostridia bacterium]
MRNLEECRAEIFRLGEEKIKTRRRKRSRIIAACVPLCLCVIVCAVIVLNSGGQLYNDGPSCSVDDGPSFSVQESYPDKPPVCSTPVKYVELEIISGTNGNPFYKKITDADDVSALFSTVSESYTNGSELNFSALLGENYFNGGANDNKGDNHDEVRPDVPPSAGTTDSRVSFITFRTADGQEVTYTLSSNLIYAKDGIRIINNEEKQKLLNALGLS